MARYRDGYQGGIQKYDFSLKSISRGLALVLIPLLAYTVGVFPLVWLFLFVVQHLDVTNIVLVFAFSVFLVVFFVVFLIVETFVPGLCIWVSRLRVDEGVHEITILDWNFF